MSQTESWIPVPIDSSLQQRATEVVPAPVMASIEVLPFDELSWENFERIQWRILQNVEGLREARLYGTKGQKQHGLDVVALSAFGEGVALQSKNYKRFGSAELRAAVEKFQNTERPFEVSRLIVGVSSMANSTGIVETLHELQTELSPLKLELWDQQALSDLLRSEPLIVIEFFGDPTAERFCWPYEVQASAIPPRDAVAISEALARTPEESIGASSLIREAEALPDDPARALQLIDGAQQKLDQAGFRPHALRHEEHRSKLLVELGRAPEAARRALDDVWLAIMQGKINGAQPNVRRIEQMADAHKDDSRIVGYARASTTMLTLVSDPLADVPDFADLHIGDLSDQSRLAVLAGEMGIATFNMHRVTDAKQRFHDLISVTELEELTRIRLRLILAEASEDWTDLLDDARRNKIGYALAGLVCARYARYCAVRQHFTLADSNWDEAVAKASLAQRWEDASTWVFSRRAFRSRWRIFVKDDLLSSEVALAEMGPSHPVVPSSRAALTTALELLADEKLPGAAIAAQRALRNAVVGADWVGEERARRVLASILREADEPNRAAKEIARAGATRSIPNLISKYSNTYVDVTECLAGPNYWTAGTAFRLLAEQADLIPPHEVSNITSYVIAVLDESDAGSLIDMPGFTTSMYSGAMRTIAGMAHRITEEQADRILKHFEAQPEIETNRYRYHDEHEAVACARIALTQPSLRERAFAHLVPLLTRSDTARREPAHHALSAHFGIARPYLVQFADAGSLWAQRFFAVQDDSPAPDEVVDAALSRLTTPLVHTPGVYTAGVDATGDSLLIMHLPADRLDIAVKELLQRAVAPQAATVDRDNYLLAASNLVDSLSFVQRETHFNTAMQIALRQADSEHPMSQSSHKLSSYRITGFSGDNPRHALFLAASLADSEEQKSTAKSQIFATLRPNDTSGYWPARVLQRLDNISFEDVPFLAGMGWGLRSLAALHWPRHAELEQIGRRLAHDNDVRVRRALAEALYFAEDMEKLLPVRHVLEDDPTYSVRAALVGKERL